MAAVTKQPPAYLREPHNQHIERILRRVWDRLNVNNEHFLMVIVGREGSGKSYTALKLASLIDDEFTHEQVIFRIEEFLRLLRDDEFREGGVYVLDEAGVAFGNRTWHDRGQILANQAMQLIRDHNVGLIFTLPRLGELDSQTQGRLHTLLEIRKKVHNKHVIASWKWMDPDRTDTTGKIYKKYPRSPSGNRITQIRFTPPDESIVEPYQQRKREFQQMVYDEAIDALTPEEDDGAPDTPDEIAEDIRDNGGADKYVREINNGAQRVLDREQIAAEYGIGHRKSKKVKRLLMPEVDDDVM